MAEGRAFMEEGPDKGSGSGVGSVCVRGAEGGQSGCPEQGDELRTVKTRTGSAALDFFIFFLL